MRIPKWDPQMLETATGTAFKRANETQISKDEPKALDLRQRLSKYQDMKATTAISRMDIGFLMVGMSLPPFRSFLRESISSLGARQGLPERLQPLEPISFSPLSPHPSSPKHTGSGSCVSFQKWGFLLGGPYNESPATWVHIRCP